MPLIIKSLKTAYFALVVNLATFSVSKDYITAKDICPPFDSLEGQIVSAKKVVHSVFSDIAELLCEFLLCDSLVE